MSRSAKDGGQERQSKQVDGGKDAKGPAKADPIGQRPGEGHPHAGLQAHTNFPLEARWGHIDPNTPIAPPRYSEEQLVDMVRDGIARRSVLSVNMEAYEDGTVSPASLELMRAVRRAVRGN